VNIIISVFHLSETIENHFGSGERFGVSIKYLREDKPLGTGGALNLMNPRPKKPFLVTNGDLITSFSFRELLTFHEKSLSLATMAIKEHKIKNPFGVVSMQSDKIVGFEEKPTYVSNINAGVYALNPELIDYLKPSEVVDMPTLLKRCIDAGISVMAFPIHEKWIDVGRPRDLYELDQSYKHLSL
jgi:NDP-sugar pyrophosphorylase family protein